MDSWILSAWRERQETQTAAPNVSGVCARAYIYTIISSSSSSSSPKFFFKQDNRRGEKERKKKAIFQPSLNSRFSLILFRRTLHPTFSIYTFSYGSDEALRALLEPGWVSEKKFYFKSGHTRYKKEKKTKRKRGGRRASR